MAKAKFKKGDKVMVIMKYDDLHLPATITGIIPSFLHRCYNVSFVNGSKGNNVREDILIPFDIKLLKKSIVTCKQLLTDLQQMHNILMIEQEIYSEEKIHG